MKRFLLLHAKSDDDARISSLVTIAHNAVARAAHGQAFEVMPGRDFYNARFKACGSWEAWTSEAASGTSYPTREPVFHGFLVPTARVGAGTARIVEKALGAGKPVFLFRGDGAVARVSGVEHVEPGNWQQGWAIHAGPFT